MINNSVKRKFTQLIESAVSRYTSGGILVSDVVKLKSGILNHDDIKGNEQMKEKIKELLASDLNLRVVGIKNKTPIPMSGNNETNISARKEQIDVAQEIAPGRYFNYITLPVDTLEVVCSYPNLPPIPDSWKHKSRIDLKPVPVAKAEQNDEAVVKSSGIVGTGRYMQDQSKQLQNDDTTQGDKEFSQGVQAFKSDVDGKSVVGDRALKDKNTKIPSETVAAHKDPAAIPSTAHYMPISVKSH